MTEEARPGSDGLKKKFPSKTMKDEIENDPSDRR
jgi:hypothetical protein